MSHRLATRPTDAKSILANQRKSGCDESLTPPFVELRGLALADGAEKELFVFSHTSQAFDVAVKVMVAGWIEKQLDVRFLAGLE